MIRRVVVGSGALSLGLACAGWPLAEPSARGTLVYAPEAAGAADRPSFLATRAEIAESRTVADAAAGRSGLAAIPAVQATPSASAWTVGIAVRDPDPERASWACNAVLEEMVEQAERERLKPLLRAVDGAQVELERSADGDAYGRLQARWDEARRAFEAARAEPLPVRILEPCAWKP